MAGLTHYGSETYLGALFGLNAAPTNYFLALLTGVPDPIWTGVELAMVEVPTEIDATTTGYARYAVGVGAGSWDAFPGYLANKNTITFPLPVQDWGLVTNWALCTAVTGGDVYAYGSFAFSQQVPVGYSFWIPSGGIQVALSVINEEAD